jgi:hypothetical protein
MIQVSRLKIPAVAFLALGLAACGFTHTSEQATLTSRATSPVAVQAFATTMYSFGTNQGCINCHNVTVNPLWMASDIGTAYSFARPMLDVNNPSGSIFATYAGNNHCNNPICANKANVPVVQGLLTQWAEVEINIGTGGIPVTGGTTLANPAFVTQTMAIPNPLPLLTDANPAVIRFDLTQLTPPVPALNGAILELSVRSYNTAGNEYKVYDPRLVGNSATVTLQGLHVYVKQATDTGLGTEDVNQGDFWSGVQVTVAPNPLPSPLPTGPMSIDPLTTITLGITALSTSDVITVGFASIK